MKIVIKIGGHLFPSCPNVENISDFINVLKRLKDKGHKIVVITGGGEGSRIYINMARKLGSSEFFCDLLGIEFSRLNARLIIIGLGNYAFQRIPEKFEEIKDSIDSGKIVVVGGMQPGQSTNAVGILTAEAVNADVFINATDVDGVYTTDPNKDPSAKKLDSITTFDFYNLLASDKHQAGSYELFDLVGLKVVERSKIKTYIINGKEPGNIEKILEGKKIGTLIKPS